ncbi:RidA family protein [Nonomuraea sp. NPDC050536]|uniref:RidA family protein n=1 Tax=Nonomuraea sp. NPDC050536 TaxID=3364366 RepID=UPI0037C669C5
MAQDPLRPGVCVRQRSASRIQREKQPLSAARCWGGQILRSRLPFPALGDYAGQAAKAIENMQAALAASGASMQDVISTRVLVASTRRQDLVAAWEVVRDSFGQHDVLSTLMGVTVLGYDGQLVEIEAVAAVADS